MVFIQFAIFSANRSLTRMVPQHVEDQSKVKRFLHGLSLSKARKYSIRLLPKDTKLAMDLIATLLRLPVWKGDSDHKSVAKIFTILGFLGVS